MINFLRSKIDFKASRSPYETFNPDVKCTRYARTRFRLSKSHHWLGLAGVDMNLFPSNEDIHSYAQKVANKPNTFQVGGHGNPSLMVDGATGERLDAKQHPERNLK